MVRTIEIPDSVRGVPPRIQSWLFWNKVWNRGIPEYQWIPVRYGSMPVDLDSYMLANETVWHKDYCGLCNGLQTISDPDYGYFYCICYLLELMGELRLGKTVVAGEHRLVIRSSWKKNTTLNSMVLNASSIAAKNELADAIKGVSKFIKSPDHWILLSGRPGTGKTHMLWSIMGVWYPWATYVVANEFVDWMRASLQTTGATSQIMEYLKYVPILVFDDLGMEYTTDWVSALIDELVEYRARMTHWWDHITVIATNLDGDDIKNSFMRAGISRVGSRLMDNDIVTRFYLSSKLDYRSVVRGN